MSLESIAVIFDGASENKNTCVILENGKLFRLVSIDFGGNFKREGGWRELEYQTSLR